MVRTMPTFGLQEQQMQSENDTVLRTAKFYILQQSVVSGDYSETSLLLKDSSEIRKPG